MTSILLRNITFSAHGQISHGNMTFSAHEKISNRYMHAYDIRFTNLLAQDKSVLHAAPLALPRQPHVLNQPIRLISYSCYIPPEKNVIV